MSDFETIWHFPLVRTSAGIEVTVSQIVLTALVVILGLVLAWYLKLGLKLLEGYGMEGASTVAREWWQGFSWNYGLGPGTSKSKHLLNMAMGTYERTGADPSRPWEVTRAPYFGGSHKRAFKSTGIRS